MTTILDVIRPYLMVAGATVAALLGEHPFAMLVIVAATVAATIGLYEATH